MHNSNQHLLNIFSIQMDGGWAVKNGEKENNPEKTDYTITSYFLET